MTNLTYTIKQDTDPENPREGDNIGTMVCWHRRYILGDEQPTRDANEWLSSMWAEHGTPEEHHTIYMHWAKDMSVDEIDEAHSAYMISDMIEELGLLHPIKDYPDALAMLPLYLYDHSGITMNTTGFSCGWDSGQVGWIYKVLADKTDKSRKEIETILKGEVHTYDQYLTGDIWGYEIVDDKGDVYDSCWGIHGYDAAEQEAKNILDYGSKHYGKTHLSS